MATINAIGLGLSGSQGTVNFAGTTSPTFVTPALGVASATSINFGGSSLSTYVDSTSYTPTFTFATVGDLGVSYNTQTGYYLSIGSMVYVTFNLICTPTYTTASGAARISLPLTVVNQSGLGARNTVLVSTITYPASCTYILAVPQTNVLYFTFAADGSTTSGTNLTTTHFPTATQFTITGSCTYLSTN